MAYIPAPARSSEPPAALPPAWERDDHGHLQYRRPWPWLCLHCHTVQSAERTDCRNCGAPKPTPEAQP